MKDVTPEKPPKYKPVTLVIETPEGKQIGIDISKYDKGLYSHEVGADNNERLSLTLWTGCESYESFKPAGLEPQDDAARKN